jgi:hypothetical protein
MKKIPIKKAKEVAKDLGYDQVLIFGWEKGENITHVATYGKTQEDCDQIAQGGNWFKEKVLKWPKSECCAEPNRMKKLRAKAPTQRELEAIEEAYETLRSMHGGGEDDDRDYGATIGNLKKYLTKQGRL